MFELWTIYDHPSDYPNCYVARKFLNDRPTSEMMIAPELKILRDRMEAKSLTRLGRYPDDDPCIVEVWL